MKTLLAIFVLTLAGCATPKPVDTGDRLPVYRPQQPITYPLPR